MGASPKPTPSRQPLRLVSTKGMGREDWLGSYAGLEGIADVLARMGRRARQPNPLAGAEVEFVADPAGFAQDFADWLPDARRFVAEWLDGRGRIGPVGGA